MASTPQSSPDMPDDVRQFLKGALAEDIGHGDITSLMMVPREQRCTAEIIARENCVVAGLPFAFETLRLLDEAIVCEALVAEGARVKAGTRIAGLKGPTRSMLTGERTALNILQRMTGIATLTKKYVDAVGTHKAKVLDTRKTTPQMRFLEKYAVRTGGGRNHRFGLYDGILIKDNHLKAVGGITNAIRSIKAKGAHPFLNVEVEVENLEEVKEAVEAGAAMIMLDNMGTDEMREAVKLVDGRATLEASGGITLENIAEVASTGVHYISVGALTHSAPAADLSLEITEIL